jgi:hypothetical protein
MKIDKKIKQTIIAALLLVTMALHLFIQFSHHLEETHEYSTCHEQGDHLHEYENVHCDLCNFQFTNFYFELTSPEELQVSPIISKQTLSTTTSLCHSATITNTQLRAPPVFS